MLAINISVIEDWFVDHKSLSIILLSAVINLLIYWFILRQPWLQYCKTTQEIVAKRDQVSTIQKLIKHHATLNQVQQDKINQLAQQFKPGKTSLPPALWLNQHLEQCKITRYLFTEDNSFPPGGQGRPTFNLTIQLTYQQALCALSHFARYSSGWELSKMALGTSKENKSLEMILNGFL